MTVVRALDIGRTVQVNCARTRIPAKNPDWELRTSPTAPPAAAAPLHTHHGSPNITAPRQALHPHPLHPSVLPNRASILPHPPQCLRAYPTPHSSPQLLRLAITAQNDPHPSPPQRSQPQTTPKAAVTGASESSGDEGRVSEGDDHETEEAQFRRKEDCEGEVE